MTARIRIQGVSKRFGSVRALSDVSASFAQGEIHAVLGANGAGKSTLMGVLAGFVKPDSGAVTVDGDEMPFNDPVAARKLGVQMVHQHFMLVPQFTVRSNIALAHVENLGGFLDETALCASAQQTAEQLGWPLDLDRVTRELPVGVQQRIEILKSLSSAGSILILDEPTAVLGPEEVEDLFRVLRTLRDDGHTVILIAHKLSEVMSVADRVTVLRFGKVVAEAAISDVDEEQLAEWMVGDLPPAVNRFSPTSKSTGLRVERLDVRGDRGEQAVRSVSFDVDCGQIVGIGGVDGNGQVELAEALAGVRGFEGNLYWKNAAFEFHKQHVAYIPQDRRHDGLALKMSVVDNLLVTGQFRSEFYAGPFLRLVAVKQWASDLIERFQIKVKSGSDLVGSLSGGNQQKVVVSRCLDDTPDLLIAMNPTRGLDVQAAHFVHEQLLMAKERGVAVVLFSSDIDELMSLADERFYLESGHLESRFLGATA